MLRQTLRVLLGLGMVAIGITHFAEPAPFLRIVPSLLPAPLALVYVSGFFEIAGGLGLLWSPTRSWASYGLIALYLAVFPANINMAVNQLQLTAEGTMPVWAMWARLPVQILLIALAFWVGRPDPRNGSASR